MEILEEILETYIKKKVYESLQKAYRTIADVLHNRLDDIKLGLWEQTKMEQLIEELKRIGELKNE